MNGALTSLATNLHNGVTISNVSELNRADIFSEVISFKIHNVLYRFCDEIMTGMDRLFYSTEVIFNNSLQSFIEKIDTLNVTERSGGGIDRKSEVLGFLVNRRWNRFLINPIMTPFGKYLKGLFSGQLGGGSIGSGKNGFEGKAKTSLMDILRGVLMVAVGIFLLAMMKHLDQLVPLVVRIGNAVISLVEKLIPPIVSIANTIAHIFDGIKDHIITFFRVGAYIFENIQDDIVRFVGYAVTLFGALAPRAVEFVDILLKVFDAFADIFVSLKPDIIRVFQALGSFVETALGALGRLIIAIEQPFQDFLGTGLEAFTLIIAELSRLVTNVLGFAGNVVNILNRVTDILDVVFEIIHGVLGMLLDNPITRAVGRVFDRWNNNDRERNNPNVAPSVTPQSGYNPTPLNNAAGDMVVGSAMIQNSTIHSVTVNNYTTSINHSDLNPFSGFQTQNI